MLPVEARAKNCLHMLLINSAAMVNRLGCLLWLEGNKSSNNQGYWSSLPMRVASSMSLPKCRREKLHHLAMFQTCQASPSTWPSCRYGRPVLVPGQYGGPVQAGGCAGLPLLPPVHSLSRGGGAQAVLDAGRDLGGVLRLHVQVLYTVTPGTVHWNTRYCTLEHQVL